MRPKNISVQDVFDIDRGIGNHYFFVIMEENPACEGRVLTLYVRTFDDPSYQDPTTILLKNEHDWLSEDKSWVCYQNPFLASKQFIIHNAKRFGPKLSDSLYCRVMHDFCSLKSEYLSAKWIETYHELLENRNFNCLSGNCQDLAFYPPLFVKRKRKSGD